MRSDMMTNAMTVSVEYNFQVAALASAMGKSDWDAIEPRVDDTANRILERFQEADTCSTLFAGGNS